MSQEALLKPFGDEITIDDEKFHYIIYFPNPYSEAGNSSIDLDHVMKLELAREIFFQSFKVLARTSHGAWTGGIELHAGSTKQELELYHQQKGLREAWDEFRVNHEEGCKRRDFLVFLLETIVAGFENILKLEVFLFYSRDNDELFMKIRSSEQNYEIQADIEDYPLQLTRLQGEEKKGFSETMPYASFERDPGQESSLLSYYIASNVQNEFVIYDPITEKKIKDPEARKTGTHFLYTDKIRLILSMMNEFLDLEMLFDRGIVLGHYPLHKPSQLLELRANWGSMKALFRKQNLTQIRKYFGGRIALYFGWLNFYAMWLIFPAIIGIAAFVIDQVFHDLQDHSKTMTASEISIFVFSIFLAISSTMLDQLWIREQNTLGWKWGNNKILEFEPQRPQFKGKYAKDTLTGKVIKIPTSNCWEKFKRSLTFSTFMLFIGLVVACLIAIYTYVTHAGEESEYAKYRALINAVQIKILNFIYKKVAKVLNNWENHETESKYANALAVKMFLFQFFNSYSSLFYIAFVKRYLETCVNDDCMGELTLQLGFIYLINFIMNIIELGMPVVIRTFNLYKERRKLQNMAHEHQVRTTMTSAEGQSKLYEYETPFDDYMEVIIDYGYVVMFSAAFPLVPICSLILTLVEIRVDAWKLCYLTRRPYPGPAVTLGIWFSIIQFISFAGVLTNTSILIFTTDVFDMSNENYKWLIFMALEHGLLIFKFLLSALVEDEPEKVLKSSAWRRRIINERIYHRPADQDEQKELRNLNFRPIPDYQPVKFDEEEIDD